MFINSPSNPAKTWQSHTHAPLGCCRRGDYQYPDFHGWLFTICWYVRKPNNAWHIVDLTFPQAMGAMCSLTVNSFKFSRHYAGSTSSSVSQINPTPRSVTVPYAISKDILVFAWLVTLVVRSWMARNNAARTSPVPSPAFSGGQFTAVNNTHMTQAAFPLHHNSVGQPVQMQKQGSYPQGYPMPPPSSYQPYEGTTLSPQEYQGTSPPQGYPESPLAHGYPGTPPPPQGYPAQQSVVQV